MLTSTSAVAATPARVEWRNYWYLPLVAACGYSAAGLHVYGFLHEALRNPAFYRLFLATLFFTFAIFSAPPPWAPRSARSEPARPSIISAATVCFCS
jgi:hypothetical protein